MSFSTGSSSSGFDNLICSANSGSPDAQYHIGLYFHSGIEVPCCYTRALHFFVLAARQSHAKAMHMIGICYKYGEGLPVDNHLALQWFLFSSSKGFNLANYEIGYMYYHGYGVEQHLPTAEYHLRTCIENGDRKAIPLHKEILKKLNSINI